MFELNAANVLTLVRISLIPVLAAVLLSTLAEADLLAAIVFIIASATDALDGWIARRRSEITQFGKLMDPLADKLLITSALVSLVALYRLDAWVAMVIIAREFAVTGLRMLAVEQGQVVSASVWGKLKTTTQVAMVLALIWVDRPATWVDILVYVTVAITVLSGLDYFYRLRKLFCPREGESAPAPSSHSRIETWCAEGSPPASSRRSSPSSPKRSATTLCWWIDSRFSCRAETKSRRRARGKAATTPPIISRTQSSTKRGRRCAFSTTAPSSERFISS